MGTHGHAMYLTQNHDQSLHDQSLVPIHYLYGYLHAGYLCEWLLHTVYAHNPIMLAFLAHKYIFMTAQTKYIEQGT